MTLQGHIWKCTGKLRPPMGHSSSAINCPYWPQAVSSPLSILALGQSFMQHDHGLCFPQLPSSHLADYTTCPMSPAGLGQPTGQANTVQSALPLTKHGDNLPGNQECEKGLIFPNLTHRDPTVTAHELLWEKNKKKTKNSGQPSHRGTETPSAQHRRHQKVQRGHLQTQ